ncbi:MFS transporter [Oscillatoria sp. FACHB-1406]|uniref:MFS transporter n=1 Tax=Oscillatoria sp. FACHB-1406 TaxID=2692846 RepID=UPI001688E723|nr:MFS transporter [Oscillatoria sp. FACHB-1406]MBD2579681.1 MFS transporter [Oscillatoria sp. FACHB-1406]
MVFASITRQCDRSLLLALGTAHGVADASAAFLLASLARGRSLLEISLWILLYNALAFGAQAIAGLLVDRALKPHLAAIGGLLLLAFALPLSGSTPIAAVFLAGCGSALFHPGGGAIANALAAGKITELSVFAAPGVVGLAIGGIIGLTQQNAIAPFFAALLLLAGTIALLVSQARFYPHIQSFKGERLLENREVWIAVLLGAIALRSAIWNLFQQIYLARADLLLALAIAAALGKLLGGFLGDRVGAWRWTQFALLCALPLLWLGERHFTALLLGIVLLQSTTPIAWAAMLQVLPDYPATATGLTLGVAIAFGGILFILEPLRTVIP